MHIFKYLVPTGTSDVGLKELKDISIYYPATEKEAF